jgi:hypothetical protein
MTMRVVILDKDKIFHGDGLTNGEEHFIHRTDALRYIEEGKAVLPEVYKSILKKAADDEAEEKKKVAEARKAELLKKKIREKTAVSKKASTRSRAVKK